MSKWEHNCLWLTFSGLREEDHVSKKMSLDHVGCESRRVRTQLNIQKGSKVYRLNETIEKKASQVLVNIAGCTGLEIELCGTGMCLSLKYSFWLKYIRNSCGQWGCCWELAAPFRTALRQRGVRRRMEAQWNRTINQPINQFLFVQGEIPLKDVSKHFTQSGKDRPDWPSADDYVSLVIGKGLSPAYE